MDGEITQYYWTGWHHRDNYFARYRHTAKIAIQIEKDDVLSCASPFWKWNSFQLGREVMSISWFHVVGDPLWNILWARFPTGFKNPARHDRWKRSSVSLLRGATSFTSGDSFFCPLWLQILGWITLRWVEISVIKGWHETRWRKRWKQCHFILGRQASFRKDQSMLEKYST